MYMHLRMYEHDAFNQRNTPKTRLNEILYIEKMLLPSLSCRLLPEPDRTVSPSTDCLLCTLQNKHSWCLYGGLWESPKRFFKILLRGKELVDIFRARLIEFVLAKLVLLQKKIKQKRIAICV